MNGEALLVRALLVNLFLTLKVLLVGGFLLVLPRISRKGLLFGSYVGEEFAEREEARRRLPNNLRLGRTPSPIRDECRARIT